MSFFSKNKTKLTITAITVIALVAVIILLPFSKITSAGTIKDNVLYTSDNTKAWIKIDNPISGEKLVLFNKVDNIYKIIKSYDVNQNSDGLNIDLNLNGGNSANVFAAIIPVGQNVNSFDNATDENFQNANIMIEDVTVYLMKTPIISCSNFEGTEKAQYTNQDISVTLDVPVGVDKNNIKSFFWKIGDGTWNTYDPNNKINVSQNGVLYAKFVDNNGVESPIEEVQITHIIKETAKIKGINLEKSSNYKNVKAGDTVTVNTAIDDSIYNNLNGISLQDSTVTVHIWKVGDNDELTELAKGKAISIEEPGTITATGTATTTSNSQKNFKSVVEFVAGSTTTNVATVTNDGKILVNMNENESRILVTADIKDKLGNESEFPLNSGSEKYDLSNSYYYDEKAPEINLVNDLNANKSWVKDGDSITATVVAKDVSSITSVKTKDGIDIKPSQDGTYTFGFNADQNKFAKEGHVAFDIIASDYLGNTSNTTCENNNIQYDNTAPVVDNIKFEKEGGSSDQEWVKDGDTIKVIGTIKDSQSGIKSGKDNLSIYIGDNNKQNFSKDKIKINSLDTNGNFEGEFNVGVNDGNITTQGEEFSYKAEFYDNVGNKGNASDNINNIKYDKIAPEIDNDSIKFTKDTEKDGSTLDEVWVKDGDTIKVTGQIKDDYSGVNSDKDNLIIYIGDDNGNFSKDKMKINKLNTDGTFEGEFNVGENSIKTSQGKGFKYKAEFSDNAGNQGEGSDINSDIKYDSEKPECSNIVINKISGSSNGNVIKNGDKFKVTFNLNDTESGILGENTKIKLANNIEISKFKETNNNTFEADFVVNGLSDDDNYDYIPTENTPIKIQEIDFCDIAGNEAKVTDGDIYNNTTGKKPDLITYYAPIADSNEKVESSNKDTTIVKNGENVKINFTTTHPVNIKSCNFEGADVSDTKGISISSKDNNKMDWTLEYPVQAKTNDQDYIHFQITLDDDAENVTSYVNDTKDTNKIKYYAPIQVSDVLIKTNNEKDQNKYAKNGDNVTVSFKSNHKINMTKNMAIANEEIKSSDNSNDTEYSFTKTINEGELEDLAIVPFDFAVSDEAGNSNVEINNTSQGVTNSIQYFKPIDLTSTISTSGVNQDYVKDGDSITLDLVTNHNTKIDTASICDRDNVQKSSEESAKQSILYQIPTDESGIKEGEIDCQASVIDLAGNKAQVSQIPRKITYDRTLPTVAILPDFNGFTNKDITYDAVFADQNIDAKAISLNINGSEKLSDDEKASAVANKSLNKSIVLSDEGEYDIDGTIGDMASNKCASDIKSKIIIDKTNPEITLSKIETDKPMVFKKGYVISSNLNINETYLKDIVCKVTDNTGALDWNIDEPIETDGKKSIDLLATDMAGNSSKEVAYDIYIDATEPKVKIKDTDTDKDLDLSGKGNDFISKVNLNCSLENLSVGSEEPDKFTKIQLLDNNDNVIEDLLNDTQPVNGEYSYEIKNLGEYKLKAEAVDAVGNATEPLEYSFTVKDKSIFVKLFENKPVFYSGTAVIIVLIFSAFIFLLSKIDKSTKLKKVD